MKPGEWLFDQPKVHYLFLDCQSKCGTSPLFPAQPPPPPDEVDDQRGVHGNLIKWILVEHFSGGETFIA